MKKKLTRIWGIGLIVVLLSTLFIAATPASGAEPLRWEGHFDTPSGAFYHLIPGSDVLDYAIANDGMTYYAVTGDGAYMATAGAAMGWTDIKDRIPGHRDLETTAEAIDLDTIDLVAVAPDDPSIVVVVDASANGTNYIGAAISADGATSFSSLGTIGNMTVNDVITGVEISPMVTGGYRYIALFGKDAATNGPVVYYYNFGAAVGSWQEAIDGAGWDEPVASATIDNIEALAFSPNFPSDYMAVALSEQSGNATDNGTLRLHILSFNSLDWDAYLTAGYPVTIYNSVTPAAGMTVESASLALLPDYDGGDESLRIAYAGAAITDAGAEAGGVWRCYDYLNSGKIFGGTTAVGINSVAFDGVNLAAGGYLDNNVYRSADPLATSPTFLGSRGMKEIGIDDGTVNDKVQLQFAGDVLYGAKVGAASALSKSLDYGNTWNDFTLMDSGFTNPVFGYPYIGAGTIDDVYFTAAGDPWYCSAHTADNITSVYRISMWAATRVLTIDGGATETYELMLRGVADDPDVVYAADKGGTAIYYTADGGLTRWYKRTAPASIGDIAVESAKVIYVGSGVKVYKSEYAGFTWGLPADTKITAGTVYSMLSVSEDNLLVGSTGGGISYSTDGGASFTKTFGLMGATNALVAATGLSAGDYIFAAAGNSNAVYRHLLGTDVFFNSMNVPADSVSAVGNTGLVLTNGVLYALSANATSCHLIRTLSPTEGIDHPEKDWGTRDSSFQAMNVTPSALKAHAGMGGSIVLEAVDSFNMGFGYASVYYFDDNIALAGPTLTSPESASLVEMNSISGNPYNVNCIWSRISYADAYQVELALDSEFTSKVSIDDGTTAIAPYDTDVAREVVSSADTVATIIAGTDLQPGSTYYWRVRSYLPVTSAWSETRSFTVQPGAAEVPTIGSPANGGTITDGAAAAFSWSPVAGADTYEFQLATDTTFASPLYSETLATTGVQPGMPLEVGVTYFWRVRALEPVEGDWSIIANFTVAAPAEAPVTEVTVPEIKVPEITVPEIVVPEPKVVIEEAPEEPAISEGLLLAIIIIGAVLVIAVIVLIVRTRRQV